MAKFFGFMLAVFLLGTALSNCLEVGTADAIAATRLTSSLSREEVSTINVATTSGFPTAGIVIINSETITYTSKTSTTFVTLTRGDYNTDAGNHSNGTKVYTLAAGTLNTASGFQEIESLSEGGPLRMLWSLPRFWTTAASAIITNDYSFLEGEVYGFPMYWLSFPLMIMSAILIVMFFVILVGIAQGLAGRRTT